MNSLTNDTKTKIVVTMGPAINSLDMIEKLIRSGEDVFRLNFSHGSHKDHLNNINMIRKVSKDLQSPTAILQDLQGPKIRLETFEQAIKLKEGSTFSLLKQSIIGNENQASLSYPSIIDEVDIGDKLVLNDGAVILEVSKKSPDKIETKVLVGGDLSDHKGLNVPDRGLNSIPALTPKDIEDLRFGLEQKVDYIAISFVRQASDIDFLINTIEEENKKIKNPIKPGIIAKIEKPQAVENIDSILEKVDGIMVARGDLGIEMDITKLPGTQRMLISKADRLGKLVITATQMLDSMTWNYTPSRAEVTDVANAVLDGTDAVMLSGESAVGKYPIRTVQIMNEILKNTEAEIADGRSKYRAGILQEDRPSFAGAISESVAAISKRLKIKAIVCTTTQGNTPRILSKCRPSAPILSYCLNEEVRRKVNLMWGTIGKVAPNFSSLEEIISYVEQDLNQTENLKAGDYILLVVSLPLGQGGEANTIKIHRLADE